MVRMWASLGLAFAISPIFFLLWVNYAFCEFRQFKSVVVDLMIQYTAGVDVLSIEGDAYAEYISFSIFKTLNF